MRTNYLAAVTITCVLIIPTGAAGRSKVPELAHSQQTALAQQLLSGDRVRRGRAVFVAEALGPSRMSEDVRFALVSLLEQINDEKDAARAAGIPTNDAVNSEFFLWVARVVATLGDARAIPALARVGNHGSSTYVEQGLASFGEQAVPAILEVIEAPGATGFAVYSNLRALSMMIEEGGANGVSVTARQEIARVTRDILRHQRGGSLAVSSAINLAIALDEPDLVQTVRELTQGGTTALTERGIPQSSANLIHKQAVDALSRIPDDR